MTDPNDIDYQRQLATLKINHAREVFGFAAAYENAIIVAGYAAFFGLWAGVGKDLTPTCRTVTAALMCTSIFCYVVWHIAQMLVRQKYEFQQAKAFELKDDPPAFLAEWEAIRLRSEGAWAQIIVAWRPIFATAVITALLAAITLVWNAAAIAFRLPLQLTG